jgi:hypothetical protein
MDGIVIVFLVCLYTALLAGVSLSQAVGPAWEWFEFLTVLLYFSTTAVHASTVQP